MNQKYKAILKRFLRGAIAGATAQMATVGIFAGNSFSELKTWLFALALSGFTGFLIGAILAIDKWARYKD